MEKLVLSWKYWACLVLTGAAVILVLGEPGEWLNASQWWTQFVVQKAAGVTLAACAWRLGRDLFSEWEEE